MSNSETYRARFRFRLQKKLKIKSREYPFKVQERNVVLSPQLPDLDISDSEWLVMNTTGFECEGDAKAFASKLKSACEVSSAAARLGIDSGTDLPTSGFGKLVKDRVREQSGLLLRDNVHGVDVFLDDPKVSVIDFAPNGTVMAPLDPFLSDIRVLYEAVERASQRTRDIVLLLNCALLQPEPVAQIVFAISAVERLGQNTLWSDDQTRLINDLVASAQVMEIGTESEREEVAFAIKKIHKKSLRKGVKSLLKSLDLEHIIKTWDDLYAERSTLVHGLAPKPGVDYHDLARRSVDLCGQILLKEISLEIPDANNHVSTLYKL